MTPGGGDDAGPVSLSSVTEIGAATAQSIRIEQHVSFDVGQLLDLALKQGGYVSPEKARVLEEQVARTEADLTAMRQSHPDWRGEIDAASVAYNAGDLTGARAAFARIDALIAARRSELAREEARSKVAQATLFHPFEASKAAPLLLQAARLAETDIWYWLKVGRALWAVGNTPEAVRAARSAVDLARNSGAERDLGAGLDTLGDLATAQGDLAAAGAAYGESLRIARALAAQDPGNAERHHDVSVSLEKVGDLARGQGDLAAAGAAYDESLHIARALAAQDPGNAEWQRGVSVRLNKLGDLATAQGDLAAAGAAFDEGLRLVRALAAQDPGNAERHRDVSVSLEKVGDLARAQGDLAAAGAAYDEGLRSRRALAAQDPGNAEWRRDVSVGLFRVGDLAIAKGDLAGAGAAYDESLRICRALAAQDPGNADWQRDVWVSLWRIAPLSPDEAPTIWAEVVSRIEDMQAAGTLAPTDLSFLDAARAQLEAARAAGP